MTLLKDILYKVQLISTSGDMSVSIREVHFDSRKVGKGDLFVAVRGTQTDGHKFIKNAIQQGAVPLSVKTTSSPMRM